MKFIIISGDKKTEMETIRDKLKKNSFGNNLAAAKDYKEIIYKAHRHLNKLFV